MTHFLFGNTKNYPLLIAERPSGARLAPEDRHGESMPRKGIRPSKRMLDLRGHGEQGETGHKFRATRTPVDGGIVRAALLVCRARRPAALRQAESGRNFAQMSKDLRAHCIPPVLFRLTPEPSAAYRNSALRAAKSGSDPATSLPGRRRTSPLSRAASPLSKSVADSGLCLFNQAADPTITASLLSAFGLPPEDTIFALRTFRRDFIAHYAPGYNPG